MGYYTYHTLETLDGSTIEIDNEIKEALKGDGNFYWNLAEFENTILSGEASIWYKREENMIKLSKKYPDVVFRLNGEGEDSGDVWREYYKNGKHKRFEAKFIKAKFRFDDKYYLKYIK